MTRNEVMTWARACRNNGFIAPGTADAILALARDAEALADALREAARTFHHAAQGERNDGRIGVAMFYGNAAFEADAAVRVWDTGGGKRDER